VSASEEYFPLRKPCAASVILRGKSSADNADVAGAASTAENAVCGSIE
jgi:hypothetical protein